MALKGLVIRQPWIELILHGEKTWEMRSRPWSHRGPVALIAKGKGTVVGLAEMVDVLPPLSEAQLKATYDKHRIPPEQIAEVQRHRWTRPWVLTDAVRLSLPVPYKHTSGGSFVNLTEQEEAAVYRTRLA